MAATGSWRRVECGGVLGFELQRLQPRRRRGTAAASFGAQGGGNYRMLGTTGQGGIGSAAHRGAAGMVSGLGDVR